MNVRCFVNRDLLLAVLCTAPLVLSSCATDADEDVYGREEVGEASAEIEQGSLALGWMRSSAVVPYSSGGVGGCTATKISASWILTAYHCNQGTFYSIQGYPVSSISPSGVVVPISLPAQLQFPPGYIPPDPASSPLAYNQSDITVFQTADDEDVDPWIEDVPAATIAVMAWKFPPSGTTANGWQVGAGHHNGDPNPLASLFYADAFLYGQSPQTAFLTPFDQTNHGDSGGPFYDSSMRILGVLHGDVGTSQNQYTSVPFHLAWILNTINYVWPGTTSGLRRIGSTLDTFPATTVKVCQYACEKTGTSCVAYNYGSASGTCVLLSSVTGSFASPNWSSGLR